MEQFWVFLIVLLFICVTYGFGALYFIVCDKNRKFILKTGGWKWFCLNSAIGVPFHEISHLIFAVIFRHRITGVALFRPFKGRQDGNLGYVRHSYNRSSLWQTLGNFFIGVAPMLFGSAVLLVILLTCYPECFNIQTSFESEIDNWTNAGQSFDRLLLMFEPDSFFRLPMLLLIVFAVFVCPHLGMSKADFKGVLTGTMSLLGAGWIIPFYLTSWKNWLTYDQIISGLTVFMIYYFYALLIGFVISALVMLFNFVLSRLHSV